jgi:TRAP-type C4-dicarboxylate transport system permease small subunit
MTRGPLFYIGSAALLAAMAVDAAAVICRHLGLSILGSIEIVQAAMLLASSAALVAASLARKHAAVHLAIDRVGPRTRIWLERISAFLSAVFFFALGAGSIWIAFDLRHGHEASEVLRIPYAPLRIVSIAAVLGLAGIALWQMRRIEPE